MANETTPCVVCGRDCTHVIKDPESGTVFAHVCEQHMLDYVREYTRQLRMAKRRRFWAKVLMTPLYPFVWAE